MVLTYHEITPKPGAYIYSVDCAAFEEHLGFLQALSRCAAAPAITFDDGHASHHRYGLPLLQKFGRKATFFVTAGWTDARPQYMSWQQLKDLVDEGHQVQSHGWSHTFLTACSPAQLTKELRSSRTALEDRLGVVVSAISMPGGRWNRQVALACAKAGYTELYTSDPWSKPVDCDGVHQLGRCMIRREMRPVHLQRLLAAENNPLDPLRLAHTAKRTVRTVLGDRLYQKLWHLLGSGNNRQEIDSEYAGTTLQRDPE